MLYNLARRLGIDVSDRWYDLAYSDGEEIDEAELALQRFYSDIREVKE